MAPAVALLWIYPIVLILLNSLKNEGTFTTSTVFQLPTRETFAGLSQLRLRRDQDGLSLQSWATASSSPFPVWP